ncbi:HPF/RaiA family ribosome-associated protein [Candidatus Peregrinibacteria bacterium]|nr:HPF/RaiA family ribosome-associated protein [Candidatus Peregrinibacteria bacterium]
METVFFFKNMSQPEEEKLRDYVFTKLPKFEKILNRFPADAVILQVKCQRFDKHSAYEVELVLKLPSETLSACEASHMITKAVDLAKDRLDMQVKKNILSVRREHRSIKARNKLKLRIAQET